MPTSLTIRKAIKKDVPHIVHLMADDSYGKHREQLAYPLSESYYQAFEKIDRDTFQELLVVEDEEGVIVGTMQLSFLQYLSNIGGMRAQLENVMVRKDRRGEGIGKQMILWASERAKNQGAVLLQLTSNKKRLRAIQFYKSLGFETSHEGMKLHF